MLCVMVANEGSYNWPHKVFIKYSLFRVCFPPSQIESRILEETVVLLLHTAQQKFYADWGWRLRAVLVPGCWSNRAVAADSDVNSVITVL